MKKVGILLFHAVIIYAAGFATANLFRPTERQRHFTESRLKGEYQFINPLLECDADAVSSETNLDSLRNSVQQYIDQKVSNKQLSHVSVYYRDMNNGPWFGIKEKELFSPASLIKVPLMIAYLKKSESDPSILEKELIASSSADYSSQNFIPKVTLVPDQKYTIRELINRLIIYSDNQAYDLLLANIDNSFLFKVFGDLGIDISPGLTNPNGDILSVKAYASFFRILYNASFLSPKLSEEALKILGQSQFNNALVAGVDPNTQVAHKYGERSYQETGIKQLHDCGIVYLPGKPYLICIMTKGSNFENLTNSIKEISRQIFDHVKKP